MFKKTALCALTALFTTPLLAAIPIESRGLSQSNNPAAQAAISTSSDAPVQTNTSWQIMQKNQQLENDLRSLRGKMEEQENEIERLKSELTNRYADLDQRLELLQQKIEPTEDTSTEDNQQDISPSLSSNAPVATHQVPTTQQPSEQEKVAYTIALDAYKNGGAAKAIAPMQNFIKNNPNSVYISNAHFWLAEFNLSIDPPN